MAKRESERESIRQMAEDHGFLPKKLPPPTCEVCSEPAVIGAYTFTRVFHFCGAHRAEADATFERRRENERLSLP
jgi:hypothetical protein